MEPTTLPGNDVDSTSPSQLQDITLEKSDIVMRNTSSGLTMKEYEEQLKKLTAENFNLKLRIYFVEERLSKVKGISDKEELIKKIIELQVACEAKSKELESKQELIYEASKALDTLQLEHEEQLKKLKKEKEKEVIELRSKIEALEQALREPSNNRTVTDPNPVDYEKQISEIECQLKHEQETNKQLHDLLKDAHLELEAYQVKIERVECESEQRLQRLEEIAEELETRDQEFKSSSFRIRKLEDELASKQREEEIMIERLEEKNKTIDSLKASLATRDTTITLLEAKCAKERSSLQSIQAKFDSISFQNNRLKAEVEMLHSRLKRCSETARQKKSADEEDLYKQKYEEFVCAMEEREKVYSKKITEFEEKCLEKEAQVEEYKQMLSKNKKLEDDHRKACAALRNFIKRSTEEKKERETLKAALRAKEDELSALRSQIEKFKINTSDMILVDNKLSLGESGDDMEQKKCGATEKDRCCKEKEKEIKLMVTKLEKKESLIEEYEGKMRLCTCRMNGKMERIQELEAEIMLLKYRIDDKDCEEAFDSSRGHLHGEMESKICEIEKLKNELNRQNHNLQELVNKELRDKNIQVEMLEKRLNASSERKELELTAFNQQILARDQEIQIFENNLQGLPLNETLTQGQGNPNVIIELPEYGDNAEDYVHKLKTMLVECISEKNHLSKKVYELNEKLRDALERDCEKAVHGLECTKVKEDVLKTESFRREAAEVCTVLILRLEELAGFLDSLLGNRELLNGIGLKRRQDIKHAVEKSRELSRHLTASLISKHNDDGTLILHPDEESFAELLNSKMSDLNKSMESLGVSVLRDKVIAEQSAIIVRLREQLQTLNEEIKQRDIEISHCQVENTDRTRCDVVDNSVTFINVSTQVSVPAEEIWQQMEKEISPCDRNSQRTGTLDSKRRNSSVNFQDASESEAWSEPDRSVSLARMGHLDESMLNLSIRSSKLDDSTDESSDETLHEKSRNSAKLTGKADSEIRRLQLRIKLLDEANENLRKELNSLKNSSVEVPVKTRYQKNEEANIIEKLNRTIEQLEESRMACRQLEDRLSEALERSNASAIQLVKANETISFLEEEIKHLKLELENVTMESNKKSEKIEELKTKLEERILETELRLVEAIDQKEMAERKTLEVECRLKEAENMSREVQSRVVEIEKKINETKKFKKETIMQFKEAERNVDTAGKIMEEAERMKLDAERKSKDFQNYVDLMRKDVEERVKEAERKVKRAEKEKEDMEKHLSKLKKKLIEAEENKSEVELKVKDGKETIQCMEEKLKELEIAMDQCNKEAQRRIKEIQKKADARVVELEHKIQEREWIRKTEAERKMMEAEKISRELEIGFKRQLEDAEKRIKESKDIADYTIKKIEDEFKKQEADLRQKIKDVENEKDSVNADLRRQLDEVRVEASELELELTRLTNEKIHLEEELKRMLDKESALVKDNKEIKGKYEKSIHELENKLSKLTMNKSELASRLEEIESTNIDLVSRISAIRGKELKMVERDFGGVSSPSSPLIPQTLLTNFLTDVELGISEVNGINHYGRQLSEPCDSNDQLILGIQSIDTFAQPRRNMNSSPDLGIESDPGRFSSLEAQHQMNMDPVLITGKREESDIKRLESENAELRRRLVKTRQALEETLTQLSAANQRKKQVERAICKQLHKTHHVLKRARVNFEGQDTEYID